MKINIWTIPNPNKIIKSPSYHIQTRTHTYASILRIWNVCHVVTYNYSQLYVESKWSYFSSSTISKSNWMNFHFWIEFCWCAFPIYECLNLILSLFCIDSRSLKNRIIYSMYEITSDHADIYGRLILILSSASKKWNITKHIENCGMLNICLRRRKKGKWSERQYLFSTLSNMLWHFQYPRRVKDLSLRLSILVMLLTVLVWDVSFLYI